MATGREHAQSSWKLTSLGLILWLSACPVPGVRPEHSASYPGCPQDEWTLARGHTCMKLSIPCPLKQPSCDHLQSAVGIRMPRCCAPQAAQNGPLWDGSFLVPSDPCPSDVINKSPIRLWKQGVYIRTVTDNTESIGLKCRCHGGIF